MITVEAIAQAKRIRGWIIAYLKDRIHGLGHFEAPWNNIEICGSNITMKCPCDDIAVTTSLDNIKAYTILSERFAPHQGLKASEILDRLTCSEYLVLRTCFRDRQSLIEALEELYGKGNVKVHESPQHLRGYQNDVREETAEIIVRKEHVGSMSNDLGFKLQPDGSFSIIRSEYDKRSHFSDDKLHKLEALYALKSIENTVAEQRQSCEVEPEVNGIIKVKIYL